jgi:hypothetical protein
MLGIRSHAHAPFACYFVMITDNNNNKTHTNAAVDLFTVTERHETEMGDNYSPLAASRRKPTKRSG